MRYVPPRDDAAERALEQLVEAAAETIAEIEHQQHLRQLQSYMQPLRRAVNLARYEGLNQVITEDITRFARVLRPHVGGRQLTETQVTVAYCVIVLDMTLMQAARIAGASPESAGGLLTRLGHRCGLRGAREFRHVIGREYWRAVGREEAI